MSPNSVLRRYLGMNICLVVSPLRGAWRLTLWSNHETSGIVKLRVPPQQRRGSPFLLGW